MLDLKHGPGVCLNCGSASRGNTFEGVVVCSECERLAIASMDQAERTFAELRVVFKESIRVALASGKFRQNIIVKEGDTAPPTAEEMADLAGRLAGWRGR